MSLILFSQHRILFLTLRKIVTLVNYNYIFGVTLPLVFVLNAIVIIHQTVAAARTRIHTRSIFSYRAISKYFM